MPIDIPNTKSFWDSLSQGSDFMNQLMMAPIERKHKQAQAEREQAMSRLPFGGANVPGPAGQVVGLEMVKNLYGENSPQYKLAKENYDLNTESTKSRVNYQNVLTESAPKRFSTPLAKTAQEHEDIKNGYLPGTKIPLTDEQRKQYNDMYGLHILKQTTDANTRQRNLLATNVEKTISQINPKALTYYSGPKGLYKFGQDKAKDLRGETTPQYKAYQEAETNAKLLGKQVRQFYGDSIQPSMIEKIQALTDPGVWSKSPEIALARYNAFVKTLNSEMKTYRNALKSPGVYFGNEENAENQNETPTSANEGQPKFSPEGKVILYKGKDAFHIPPNEMREALDSGEFTLEPQ